MKPVDRSSRRGVAMVTAIVLALAVSATAAVVLSLTFRRFELSAFRTDHTVAVASAEAGFQYAFARLNIQAFRDAVQNKRTALGAGAVAPDDPAAEYIVTCNNAVNPRDELVPELHVGTKVDTNPSSPTFGQYVGGKHVTLRIRFFTAADAAPVPNRSFRVR